MDSDNYFGFHSKDPILWILCCISFLPATPLNSSWKFNSSWSSILHGWELNKILRFGQMTQITQLNKTQLKQNVYLCWVKMTKLSQNDPILISQILAKCNAGLAEVILQCGQPPHHCSLELKCWSQWGDNACSIFKFILKFSSFI